MGYTEAVIVVPIVRVVVVVAIRDPTVLGIVVPATATQHTIGALGYSPIFCSRFFLYSLVDACWVNANNGNICL